MAGSDTLKIARALISVTDKTGIIDLAKFLVSIDCEILATSSTSKYLKENNIPVTNVSDVTNFPEIMNGRVKTLHPKIYGGILGKRDKHESDAKQHNIAWIDLLVCNFYQFDELIKSKDISKASYTTALELAEVVESIDIGGPTMVRAAAKNHEWVTSLIDQKYYSKFIEEYNTNKGISKEFRTKLAIECFAKTAKYDASIYNFYNDESTPEHLLLSYSKDTDLRYGENPHQKASVYKVTFADDFEKLNGKELSYNNLVDIEAAIKIVREFPDNASAVVIKHATPCGVAVSNNANDAFIKAFNADKKSAFGGIVAINKTCNDNLAKEINKNFIEVIIAPNYTDSAIKELTTKTNLRVIKTKRVNGNSFESNLNINVHAGFLLAQSTDKSNDILQNINVVTKNKPTSDINNELNFCWNVVKHVKSNAIVISKNNVTLGIGAGQVSRVDAVEIALNKAKSYGFDLNGAVLASDGFFPFADNIELLKNTGIKHVIQPGGSIRDNEVIDACNENDISMIFTGIRCFYH